MLQGSFLHQKMILLYKQGGTYMLNNFNLGHEHMSWL